MFDLRYFSNYLFGRRGFDWSSQYRIVSARMAKRALPPQNLRICNNLQEKFTRCIAVTKQSMFTNTNRPAQKVACHQVTTILLQSSPSPSIISYLPWTIDPNRFLLGYLVRGKKSLLRSEGMNTILSIWILGQLIGQLSEDSFVSLPQPNRIQTETRKISVCLLLGNILRWLPTNSM